MDLPTFRYHPDPVATGSIAESNTECACCDQRRGYIYVGPVHAIEELRESIWAPEVIAHGRATLEVLRADLGWEPGKQLDDYIRALDADDQPTAYLFRCLHCGAVGGYSDFT